MQQPPPTIWFKYSLNGVELTYTWCESPRLVIIAPKVLSSNRLLVAVVVNDMSEYLTVRPGSGGTFIQRGLLKKECDATISIAVLPANSGVVRDWQRLTDHATLQAFLSQHKSHFSVQVLHPVEVRFNTPPTE